MYKPFTSVKDVDPYIMHTVELGDEVVTIIGAEQTANCLFILALDCTGSEVYMPAPIWFSVATYRGRPFGMQSTRVLSPSYRYVSAFPN